MHINADARTAKVKLAPPVEPRPSGIAEHGLRLHGDPISNEEIHASRARRMPFNQLARSLSGAIRHRDHPDAERMFVDPSIHLAAVSRLVNLDISSSKGRNRRIDGLSLEGFGCASRPCHSAFEYTRMSNPMVVGPGMPERT